MVKKHFFLIAALISVGSMYGTNRVPNSDQSGLLIPDGAIALTQDHFKSGTLRLKDPGYYYLETDIEFEPDPVEEATRTDKPQTAWFAALTIECDNVVLDLNKKTFAASEAFLAAHDFKVFCLVELNNSPFPHFIFAFTGETEIKTAHNATIKNGTLGRSSHHGIHGNGNSNIQIYDLVIKDWEVAAISLNGFQSGVIRNCTISGVEHAVPFTGLVALMQSTRLVLEQLRDGGDVNAQAYIDDLDVMMADPAQNGRTHPSGTHDGNAYGIFLNRTLDVGPVVTQCSDQTTNAVLIENVMISNMKTEVIETVGIANNDGDRLKGDLFGVLRWQDAYPSGTFAPNALLKAQVYGVQQRNPGNHPTGFAANILSVTPNEATFLSQVRPVFNGDFAGHTDKGAFGIRLDCGHGVTVKNCIVMGIESNGDAGKTLADLPGGSNYSFDEGNYTGSDVRGISLAASHNCHVVDTQVLECSSLHGDVYGVALFNESDANLIERCVSSDHHAYQDDVNSTVNPSSQVYSFFVDNHSNSNRLVDCVSQCVTAPRYGYGFYVHDCRDTLVQNGLSSNHQVTSSSQLDEAKLAYGFVSVASQATRFENCIARQMYCANEGNADNQSKSIAAGFRLAETESNEEDNYGVVTHSLSECNNGGAGKAYGIILKDANFANITHNTVANNHTDRSEKGYGIYMSGGSEDSIVLGNVAYGNTKKNYEPKDTDWPILKLDADDVDSSKINNPWYNTEIDW